MDKKWTKIITIFPIIIILFFLFFGKSFFSDNEQYDASSQEAKLEQALMQIEGVGQVKVYFHYDNAPSEKTMSSYFQTSEKNSKVSGLLVVSEGASSPTIQNELIKIISRVMEIPSHRIMIVPMESKGDEQ